MRERVREGVDVREGESDVRESEGEREGVRNREELMF